VSKHYLASIEQLIFSMGEEEFDCDL